MSALSLPLLSSFVAFAEEGGFTAAAARLGLSQPAVHAHVKRLAADLGVQLYRREGHQLVLTGAGRRLLVFARRWLDDAARLAAEVAGRTPPAVVLAAGEGSLLYLLGSSLSDFPEPLEILTRDAEGVRQALLSRQAHLGVSSVEEAGAAGSREGGVAPVAGEEGPLQAWPLCSVGVQLIVRRGHRLGRDEGPLGLAALDGVPLALPPAGRPFRRLVEMRLRAAGATPKVSVEASGWPLLLEMARLGLGAALVNDCCPVPAGCVARPLPALPRRQYQLLYRPDALSHAPVALLARRIQRQVTGAQRG